MIIFLEATNMIIKRLEIKNLHGIYNYNVSFKVISQKACVIPMEN